MTKISVLCDKNVPLLYKGKRCLTMGKDHDYRNGVCTSGAISLTKKTSAVSDNICHNIKVHIFCEGHTILQNLPLTFDCMYSRQK